MDSEELREIVRPYGRWGAIALAELVGCSPGHIRQCLRGECWVGADLAFKIRSLPPASEWPRRPRHISNMTAQDVKQLVRGYGGFSQAAKALGIPEPTLCGYVYSGDRVPERAAKKMRERRHDR